MPSDFDARLEDTDNAQSAQNAPGPRIQIHKQASDHSRFGGRVGAGRGAAAVSPSPHSVAFSDAVVVVVTVVVVVVVLVTVV